MNIPAGSDRTARSSSREKAATVWLTDIHEGPLMMSVAAVTEWALFSSLAAAHSSLTPQWVLFRLFSTPASLRFTTPTGSLRLMLLGNHSNVISPETRPQIVKMPYIFPVAFDLKAILYAIDAIDSTFEYTMDKGKCYGYIRFSWTINENNCGPQ